MPIEVIAEVEPQSVEVDGEILWLDWRQGRFRGRYRDKDLSGCTPEEAREQAAKLIADQRASMARARRLRAAEKSPVPAVLERNLEPVGVRGMDKRSEYLLITDSKGKRQSVSPAYLLRALTEDEREEILAAKRVADEAAKVFGRQKVPVQVGDVKQAADVRVVASYDFGIGTWVAEYKGRTYTGSPSDIEQAVLYEYVLSTYPVALDGNRGRTITAEEWRKRSTSLYGYGLHYGLFESQERADAYTRDYQAMVDTQAALRALYEKYRFDASAFKD